MSARRVPLLHPADADAAGWSPALALSAEPSTPSRCAQTLMDLVPGLMDEVRRHMRAGAPAELSVPQMRVLIYARRHGGASLTDVAEHLGVTLPTISVAVQRLVEAGWLENRPHPQDRRRSTLWLTTHGTAVVQSARRRTRAEVAARLQAADAQTLGTIQSGLQALAHLLKQEPDATAAPIPVDPSSAPAPGSSSATVPVLAARADA